MKNKLKIGYLIPQFPGQTHIFFWREIMELERLGHSVSIFSTRPPPRGLISHSWSEEAIRRTEYLGNPTISGTLGAALKLPLRDIITDVKREGFPVAKDILICASAARMMSRRYKELGLDHLHVHSCARSAMIAVLAHLMTGLPYSLTLHGPMSDYGAAQRLKWRHAAFGTVITNKLLEELTKTLSGDIPETLVIQPMGVDPAVFARVDAYVPAKPGDTIKIFSCARLNIVKGHQDLLQAVRILVDRGLDVQLEIAGEDDVGGHGFHKELEAQIEKLDLKDRAHLLGAIDEASVREKLLNAHLFVLASWHEPLGVAYMEAMSCGVPTIGTDAGGVRELIMDGRDGVLVAPKTPDALADAILKIASDPEKACKLSMQGRKHIVESFNSDIGAETILKEVRALL